MISTAQIRQAIKASGVNCDAEQLGVNDTFTQLGFDSLDVYNIIIEIQEITGYEVTDSDIEKLQSIAAIEKYFAEK